jgi:hypothetical protein
MESGQKNKDLELLLNMETKIHLLDIEGIAIPKELYLYKDSLK